MTQRNLAIVFGPTVVRKEDSTGLVSDMNATYTIMELLMNNVCVLMGRGAILVWGRWYTSCSCGSVSC